MPLCARCTGIYVGVLLAFCFLQHAERRMDAGRPFSKGQAMLTALMILPIGIDGLGSYFGFWESNQLLRVLSGSLVGAVVPGFLLLAFNFGPCAGQQTIRFMSAYNGAASALLLRRRLGFGHNWLGLPPLVERTCDCFCFWGKFLSGEACPQLLLKKSLWREKQLPFTCKSLAAAFLGLYAIGGLMQ